MLIYNFEYALRYSYAKGTNFCLSRDSRATPEPTHTHDYYELSYICSGRGVHVINNVSYHVKKGSLILFAKNDSHSFYSEDQLSLINCCFRSIESLKYFPIGSTTKIINLNEEDIKEVENYFNIMEIELNRKSNYYEKVVQNCTDFLLLLFNRNTNNQITSDPIWGNLLAYISDNYSLITFSDALKITNMSKSSFCRKFKQQFSVSFLTYVNKVRIQQAQRLLTTTSLSLVEITDKVGYKNNVCRLHEDFKKYAGQSPFQYRNTYRNYDYKYLNNK